MNKVVNFDTYENEQLRVENITGLNFNNARSAFIGKAGFMKEDDLFLVCYNCVLLASEPRATWIDQASISITKWVDVEIKVK